MIADLLVYNILKPHTFHDSLHGSLKDRACFHLNTCQRELLVFADDYGVPALESAASQRYAGADACSIYNGADAYTFLLRVASGLESQMAGETEVLGQFKDAWAQSQQNLPRAGLLKPVFQKLFEDVKEIRTKYLRNTGQASYGSLVRRMLSQSKLKRPVVVVGAGAFSQSLLPWLSSFEVCLANRTLAKAEALAHTLRGDANQPGPFYQNPLRLLSLDDAFAARGHIIFTIPGANNPVLTTKAQAALTLAPEGALVFDLGEPGLLTHHSGLEHQSAIANEAVTPAIITLKDLYQAQKQQAHHTNIEHERARRAAAELSAQRLAAECMTFIHCWEDLFTSSSSV